MARATIVGNIFVVDDPEEPDPYEVKKAIVIEFDSLEELREALRTGKCEFGGLGGNP